MAFVLLGIASLLPAAWHQKVVDVMSRAERQTGFAVVIVLALVGYWGIRLIVRI